MARSLKYCHQTFFVVGFQRLKCELACSRVFLSSGVEMSWHQIEEDCPRCSGTGEETYPKPCPKCRGSGYRGWNDDVPCDECGTSGHENDTRTCRVCDGSKVFRYQISDIEYCHRYSHDMHERGNAILLDSERTESTDGSGRVTSISIKRTYRQKSECQRCGKIDWETSYRYEED